MLQDKQVKDKIFALKIIQSTFSLYSYLIIHPKKATRFRHRALNSFKILTPFQQMLWWSLIRKQTYWEKRGRVQFAYSDKRLAEELHCGINTIKRAKEELRKQQRIIYKSGLYEGSPTYYLSVQELPKRLLKQTLELPIKSLEPPNKSIRAPQQIANNNITNIITNSITKEEFKDTRPKNWKTNTLQNISKRL